MGRKYKSYTHEEYERAMELLKKGYSLTETCRILGWPETKASLLYHWRHGKHKPPLARWKAEPSKELVYVIGALNDGSVTKNESRSQYMIEFGVIDKKFAETFSRAMSRLLGVNYHEPWWDKKEKKWWVVYRSKAFYTWYEKQTLDTLKQYIEYNKGTVAAFLRGLYDAEGYNYRCRLIFLSNNNIKLLRYVQYLLKRYFGIATTGPYLSKRAGSMHEWNGRKIVARYNNHYIVIGRKKYALKFLEEIGFSIVRKQLGLKKDEKVLVEGKYIEP